jgi:hypothetical protein
MNTTFLPITDSEQLAHIFESTAVTEFSIEVRDADAFVVAADLVDLLRHHDPNALDVDAWRYRVKNALRLLHDIGAETLLEVDLNECIITDDWLPIWDVDVRRPHARVVVREARVEPDTVVEFPLSRRSIIALDAVGPEREQLKL